MIENDVIGPSRRDLLETSAMVGAGVLVAQHLITEAKAQPAMVQIAGYIATRLQELGCKTLFGIPGATCDPMFEAAHNQGMKLVITASDLEAGYAADGYARQKGLGAVCVTYGVGMLSLINAVAGAYVERSPVVVLNGGPTAEDVSRYREEDTLFSHGTGATPPRSPGQSNVAETDILGDLALFRRVTSHQVRITRTTDAAREIDKALLAALRTMRPVYVEISKALWSAMVPVPTMPLRAPPTSIDANPWAGTITARLKEAKRPILLLGEQISRFKLPEATKALISKLVIPYITTFLGKAVVPETSPLFVGVYDGATATQRVRRALAEADLLLSFGCTWGRQYRELLKDRMHLMLQVTDDSYRDGRRPSVPANLGSIITALNTGQWSSIPSHASWVGPAQVRTARSDAPAGEGLTYDAVIQAVSETLDTNMIVMVDTCLAQYPAADITITAAGGFVSNAIWNSIGYTPAAAVGVGIAEQELGGRRPLVICGDGGFQMTAQALSTLARHNVRAIIVILDNALYAIEQKVIEDTKSIRPTNPKSFFGNPAVAAINHLNLSRWDYVMLAKSMGIRHAQQAKTKEGLVQALTSAKSADGPAVISVALNPRSLPADLYG